MTWQTAYLKEQIKKTNRDKQQYSSSTKDKIILLWISIKYDRLASISWNEAQISKKCIKLEINGNFNRAIYFFDCKKGNIEKFPSINSEF